MSEMGEVVVIVERTAFRAHLELCAKVAIMKFCQGQGINISDAVVRKVAGEAAVEVGDFTETLAAKELADTFMVREANRDPLLADWILGVFHNRPNRPGDFLKSSAEAALRADEENYPIMRPFLLVMKKKFPEFSYSRAKS